VFRHTIPLGRILGITIDVDYSWFLVFGLFTWMLATGYYPSEYKDWSKPQYWMMGAITAIMLFVSVLLHELGHSAIALHYKLAVRRITLFIFGGVSQIVAEPPSASAEFWIAAAGPLISFLLALIFWELRPLLVGSEPLFALAKYLAAINLILGLFNLVPGFPLDGGRIFRAIVWGVNHNFQRATSIAAVTGRFFGFLFIVAGVWQVFAGQLLNGIWIAFIGWFLESAATSQLQQQMIKGLLVGHKVSEIMDHNYERIPGDITLGELVDKHVLTAGQRSFVVNQGSGPVGLITLSDIKKTPRSDWPTTIARQVAVPEEKLVSIRPDAELWTALEKMGRDGVNQLPVIENNAVVGMLSRDDVLHYLQTLHALHT
jgi:Zn-dependent protease